MTLKGELSLSKGSLRWQKKKRKGGYDSPSAVSSHRDSDTLKLMFFQRQGRTKFVDVQDGTKESKIVYLDKNEVLLIAEKLLHLSYPTEIG